MYSEVQWLRLRRRAVGHAIVMLLAAYRFGPYHVDAGSDEVLFFFRFPSARNPHQCDVLTAELG